MQPRMSMITLGVEDMKRSIDFYQSGLKFPRFGDEGENVAFFALNGSWLGLYPREDLADDAQVSAQGSGFNSFTISHNVESEDEVHNVMNNALAVGATLVKPPQYVHWGGFSGYFKDPDGHLWEVAYNPFFWIGPSDDV